MKSLIFVYSIVLFSIVSCSDKREVEYDISYYLENDKARAEMLDFCKKKVGNKSINCINAMEAKSKLASKNLFGDGFSRSKTN